MQSVPKVIQWVGGQSNTIGDHSNIMGDKSNEEYRRDIFVLKDKLAQDQFYKQDLQQQLADLDVMTDKSYSFSMRLKILEYTLNDIKAKIEHFAQDTAAEYYRLNYAVYALAKSCEIIGITKEMVFRAVKGDSKGNLNCLDFVNFLRETMRLDNELSQPILNVLTGGSQSEAITWKRYCFLLECFMLTEEQSGESNNLQASIERVAEGLMKEKIELEGIWQEKEVNIATTVHALLRKVKHLDVLDCVACYCRCDPLKTGRVNTTALIGLLRRALQDLRDFAPGIRLSKK